MLVSVRFNVCVCFQVCPYLYEVCVHFIHKKELPRMHISVCMKTCFVSGCPLEKEKRSVLHSRGNLNRRKEENIDTAFDKDERPNIQNGNRESEHEIERDHKGER